MGIIARSLMAWLITLAAASSAVAQYESGVHYQPLPVPVETASDGSVEVVEVFSYACVHCFDFEPMLSTWVAGQGNAIAFRRSPAIFNKTWEQLAQAYYAAEALEVTDQIHGPMFEAIHVTGENVLDPQVLAGLFAENAGVDPTEFAAVYSSFGVRSRVQQASARGRAYRVTGVPTMIVNGKYRVDGRMAGGTTGMLQVVEYLIGLEQQPGPEVASEVASE